MNLHKVLEIITNDLDEQLNYLEQKATDFDNEKEVIAKQVIKDIKEAIGNGDVESLVKLQETLPKIFN